MSKVSGALRAFWSLAAALGLTLALRLAAAEMPETPETRGSAASESATQRERLDTAFRPRRPRQGVPPWRRLRPGIIGKDKSETQIVPPGENVDEAPAEAGKLEMRLRIEWGGGDPRQWQGTIALSEGELHDPQLLGVEADEPGSMWLEQGKLFIRTPSSRLYDGLDLSISAPADARLQVQLGQAGRDPLAAPIEVPLADLMAGNHEAPLADDDTQPPSRLLVRRAPGDRIRVEFNRETLVFSTREGWDFTVRPYGLVEAALMNLRLRMRLINADTQHEEWWEHRTITLDPLGTSEAENVTLAMPDQEGVYNLELELERRGLTNRLGWKLTADRRTVQVVVVAEHSPINTKAPEHIVVEIDPANPAWWNRLPGSRLIPGMPKGPFGNGDVTPLRHPLGAMIQLGPAADRANASWQAYPLPIEQPGQPHIIEIEYPTDMPQSLGASLIEPNASGAVVPGGLDTGLFVDADAAEGVGRLAKHKIVCWPRTRTPILLLTNRSPGGPAVYGKIRVFGPAASSGLSSLGRERARYRLPRLIPDDPSGSEGTTRHERLLAGYYERPLFSKNFSAADHVDSWSGRALDDWKTFYDGGSRLVEYLEHAGFNGLVMTVLADGSTIYPAPALGPTPRYDTGIFFASGQDPVRKDVLELVFRLFDRAGLRLIPALEFAAPLPELETLTRQGGTQAEGVRMLDSGGAAWTDKHSSRRGLAPYYNPLNREVQEAMLAAVRQLADRYRHHRSFAGVAVTLSADGYANFPGVEWGSDPVTLARYHRDTRLAAVPRRKELPVRAMAASAPAAPASDPEAEAWLAWRARELSRFYRRLQEAACGGENDTKLYLAGAGMFDRPDLERQLRPALPRAHDNAHFVRALGIDLSLYADQKQIVWLRPQRIAPLGSLEPQRANLEWNLDSKLDELYANTGYPGGLFYHEPLELRLITFDDASPFERTHTWLFAQMAPAGNRNRRRFVNALARLDARAMVDGGWLLTLGQEDELHDLVRAYRQLPDAPFQSVPAAIDPRTMQPLSTQPVTIRTLSWEGETYVYLVNDSPWPAQVKVGVRAAAECQLQGLAAGRPLPGLAGHGTDRTWSLDLEPFDLVAARISDPAARFVEPRVTVASEITRQLEARIQDLVERAATLQNPPNWDVLRNAGFEQPADKPGTIPYWETPSEPESGPAGSPASPSAKASLTAAGNQRQVFARLETTRPHGGNYSVRLAGRGAALISHVIEPPRTGWLAVRVWLRVTDSKQQPTLRLAIKGRLAGQAYRRVAIVGQGSDTPALSEEWAEYAFEFPDLPTESLEDVRIRFEMARLGDVWIDDLRLFNLQKLEFSERMALALNIELAGVRLKRNEFADCYHLLDGYWPRYLVSHVPLSHGSVAAQPRPREREPEPAEPAGGPLDRVKRALGGLLR